MRLRALTVHRYGNFEHATIGFDPRPGRVNIVLAPNGAGKSVLRQAFGELLFGIGLQTKMRFRYGYEDMKLTAEAVAPDGSEMVFARKRGRMRTLVDAADQPLDDAVLRRLLGDTDRVRLEQLFAMDTALLRAGGAALLDSGGDVAAALLSAAGGVRQARGLLAELRAQRDMLAPERKVEGRAFYQAAARFDAARKVLRESLLTPDAWAHEEAALAAARAGQASARADAGAATRRIAMLERVRRVRGPLAAHDAAAAWLADHADAPVLAEGLGGRLAEAEIEQSRRSDAHASAVRELEAVAGRLAAEAPDMAVLQAADEIRALADEVGARREALRDLPKVEAEQRLLAGQVAVALVALDLPAGAAIPPPAARNRAAALCERHRSLEEARERLERQVRQREREREAAERRLREVQGVADDDALEAMRRAIRDEGDPVGRRRAAEAAVRDTRAAAGMALARVPGWRNGIEALAALAPPGEPALRRLADALDAARTRVTDAARHVATQEAEVARSRDEMAKLGDAVALADPHTLADARARREAGWALVFRQAFAGEQPTAEEIRAFSEGAPLPVAYADAVRAADEVADRRQVAAERIAAAEQLGRALGRQQAALGEGRAARAEAEGRRATDEAAWAACCADLGLPADAGIAEVRAFVAARDDAVAALFAATAAEAEMSALLAMQAGWAARLAGVLGVAPPFGPLGELLTSAEVMLAQRAQARTARAEADAELRAALKQLTSETAELGETRDQLAVWRAEWDAVLRALGRDAADTPEAVTAALALYRNLDGDVPAEAGLAHRVGNMARTIAHFDAAVRALAARVAPDLTVEDPATALREMQDRLTQARECAARLAQMQAERTRAETARQRAAEHEADAASALRAVLAQAGAEDAAVARARIALSDQYRETLAALRKAKTALAAEGDGMALEALRAEADSVAPDDAEAEMADAKALGTAAMDRVQTATQAAVMIEGEMRRQRDDDRAVTAAAAENAAAAAAGHALEEALVLHAAAALLEHGIGHVEAAGDAGLLRRIGAAFHDMTGGAYASVVARENDDGVPELRVIEPGWAEEARFKPVSALSEGTRDQLFLALRLVAIEDHAAQGAVLPFIGDDVLQSFDDVRAAAALRALAAFSATAQVIILTHHPHVAAMAEAMGPDLAHVHRIAADAGI